MIYLILLLIIIECASSSLLLLRGYDIGFIKQYMNSTSFREPFLYDPILGYRYKPNCKFDYVNTGRRGNIITDQDPDLSQKSSGKFRVLVFGGSAVAGSGITHLQQSIPHQLQEKLSEYINNIEVINCGVGGYTSYQSLLYFLELTESKPDFVVIYDGWNDLIYSTCFGGFTDEHDKKLNKNAACEFYLYLKMREQERGEAKTYFGFSPHHFIKSLSSVRLLGYIGMKLGIGRLGDLVFSRPITPYGTRESEERCVLSPSEAANAYIAQAQRFLHCLRGFGVPCTYVLQTSIFDKGTVTPTEQNHIDGRAILKSRHIIEEAYSLVRQQLQHVSTSNNQNILDGASILSAHGGEDLFVDECHMNGEGYRLVAEFIAPSIRAHVDAL
ncbi:MAG: SGNH/GDSL hydrolase family protein [Bacteroidota bacterium]